jgi:GNAT superfamily N-acetyltransferase
VTFRVEPLGAEHDLEPFDCGNTELNLWLRRHARHATAQGTRTYVLIDSDTELVAGYFALAPHLIERHEVPSGVGRGAPRHIPAILLAKLALYRSHHGQGLGAELLIRALQVTLAAARTAGGKVVVVDAIDDGAAEFYGHHDFVPLPGNRHRLVQKLSTVAKALQRPWP